MTDDLQIKGKDPGAVRYGNFINYYEFHPPENRIESLPTNIWDIPGKDTCVVLDIGCNCGELTKSTHSFLLKNSKFKTIHTLGIDIDPQLINGANEMAVENITFECMDIMSDHASPVLDRYLERLESKKFDIIFCFSVTMWIHLNFGDEGLVKFLNIVKSYSDFIVIEPQPWNCYKNASRRMKRSASETFPLYSELKFRKDVVDVIEQKISEDKTFVKIEESVSSKWKRKLLFFKHVDILSK